MKIFTVAGNLDIDSWLRGLVGAAISGGSAALSGGTGAGLMAPDQFNIHNGKIYTLIAGIFCFSAFISLTKFLAIHPLPDLKTVTTSVAVMQQPGSAPVTTSTVSETHVEKT